MGAAVRQLICCLLMSWGVSLAAVESLALSDEEKAWIAANPVIRVGAETDWPPYDFAVAGHATGYSNELVEMLAERIGLEVEFVVGPTFSELLAMLKNRELDLLPALWWNQEREAFTTYVSPYYQTRHAMFVSDELGSIESVDSLATRRIAGVRGYNSTKQVGEFFPDATLVEVDSPLDALLAISNGDADAFIGSLGVGGYYIKENNLTGIRVFTNLDGSPFASNEDLHIGVRNDWPILASLLERALASISNTELTELRNRWIISQSAGGLDWYLWCGGAADCLSSPG